MSNEYNPNPWRRTGTYVDRTYPSGVAGARPKLTPRIHCEPEPEATADPVLAEIQMRGRLERALDAPETSGNPNDDRVDWFNRALRGGHGFRNDGDE